ncbi:hypothetical protein [Streptomyces sp. NBC_01353]|uniref:hypothetical protein n=1 Tax=Streptomyces sp. NBC_01353 TaxID=2903835 RepID=UPI002E36831B|nr:hypothetical protein [Streptomyces sp. NBC_01353]
MADYSWHHIPGEAAPVHTADNAVPPLDDELAGALDDLAGIHEGIDLIRDGIRLLAVDKLTADKTQTVITSIAGTGTDVQALLGLLMQRLTNPDSNPGLRHLDGDTLKAVQRLGEQYAYETAEFAPREHPCEAAALIDGI